MTNILPRSTRAAAAVAALLATTLLAPDVATASTNTTSAGGTSGSGQQARTPTLTAKATSIAKRSKQRGYLPRGLHDKDALTAEDVNGKDPDSFFNRMLHGAPSGAAPRFAGSFRSDGSNKEWAPASVGVVESGVEPLDGGRAPDGIATLVQRQVKVTAVDRRPREPYYLADPKADNELRNYGTARNGVYLVARWNNIDGEMYRDADATGSRLYPMFPRDASVEETIEQSLAALPRARAIDTARGIVEAKQVTVHGYVLDVRYRLLAHSSGSFIVEDMWPVYRPTTVPLSTHIPASSVAGWNNGAGRGHRNAASLRTQDPGDAVVRTRNGTGMPSHDGTMAASATGPVGIAASRAPDVPAGTVQPGAAYIGKKMSGRVQLITNKAAARPAKKAVPLGTEVRMYLVDDTAPNGVTTWDVTSLESGGEVPLGRTYAMPSDMTEAAFFDAANAAVDSPSHRLSIDRKREARWKYVDGIWLVAVHDTAKDLVESVAPVDPARYAGQGARWTPSL